MLHYATFRAHRVAYWLWVGPFDERLHVLHRCDNPSCVRPDHLFLGTNADNMRDRDRKGRVAHGEDHYAAKLSNLAVEHIRRSYGPRGSGVALARKYGVSKATISMIVHGKRRAGHARGKGW